MIVWVLFLWTGSTPVAAYSFHSLDECQEHMETYKRSVCVKTVVPYVRRNAK
jgi:hypothetical protein